MSISSHDTNLSDVEELSYLQAKADRLESEKHQMMEELRSLNVTLEKRSYALVETWRERERLLKEKEQAGIESEQLRIQFETEKTRLLQIIEDAKQVHERYKDNAQSELKIASDRLTAFSTRMLEIQRDKEALEDERNSLAKRLEELEKQIIQMEQARRSNDAQISQSKQACDAEIARRKAEMEQKHAARTQALDTREQALNLRQKTMESQLRAYKWWRFTALMLFFVIAVIIYYLYITGGISL